MATPTTLPATFVSGNTLTAAQLNDLLGGFRITQFKSASTTAAQTVSTQTRTDVTSMSVTITPQATTNKILIAYMTLGEKSVDSANNNLGIFLMRGATDIASWSNGLFTGSAVRLIAPCNYLYLDSPATTSATTYKFQMSNANNNGASVAVQSGGSSGVMVVMEVSL
jgi:hypothetical protein